ncbi:transporter substrate-binding domain-containing protein [Marinobacterium sp. D7]|uniref:transporter substrate-binding domain-containing protein n=1 Tax=Marinobacterium ramblicola TaxID=2849041 RepID=UPI001C2CFF81|nr:transporter substrate-binding domain-containing protein [Marinobacterium ramblicola]MBV1789322.1 transporter substrate-binding domain-containing protein [Marinobacterium ramblicola]
MLVLMSGFVSAAPRGQATDHSNVIVVAGDHNYPPYEFINEDGEPDGYNTELTRAIAQVMGIKVEIRLGSWSEMRDALEAGEVGVLQGMSYSAERAEHYLFSPPHALIHQSIFARKGAEEIDDLSELRGKEVIVQNEGIMHDLLLRSNVGATLITVDTHADALRLLASGKHDYALVANLPGLYLGRELSLLNLVPIGKPYATQRYGYAVVKGDEELLAQFSEGLAILKNTGRQQAIYDKWFGPLENSGFPWKEVGKVAAVLSALLTLVLGAIMVWNRMLTREVGRRTEELQLQQQKLIQADKMTSLGILVSGVAHEINNPCSLLMMNLSVLRGLLQDSEEVYETYYREHGEFELGRLPYSRMKEEIPRMLEDMDDGAQRIRRIVDDLRDFARQGVVELNERVDLNEVLATAIRLTDSSLREATDRFKVDYQQPMPPVKGSLQKLEQVVINLLINACQALPDRERGISVETRVDPQGKRVQLVVEDQGCGIERENLAQLSDPFFTTKRELGGMGLGLAVSYGIVREHGGTLEYESEPGQGTRAILSIPVCSDTGQA